MENKNNKHLFLPMIPTTILENPDISSRITELMRQYDAVINKRIEEITTYLELNSCKELNSVMIKEFFRSFFCQHLATKAVRIAFEDQGSYNIKDNIIKLLTESSMRASIFGKPMVDAYARAIRIIPNNDTFNAVSRRATIKLLKSKFISTKSKKNYCGGCGCSCTCDEGCNGDWQKCTSARNCNHHCGCYISALVENMPDKNRTVQCHAKHNENCDE